MVQVPSTGAANLLLADQIYQLHTTSNKEERQNLQMILTNLGKWTISWLVSVPHPAKM